jgi:hypothetical protein
MMLYPLPMVASVMVGVDVKARLGGGKGNGHGREPERRFGRREINAVQCTATMPKVASSSRARRSNQLICSPILLQVASL